MPNRLNSVIFAICWLLVAAGHLLVTYLLAFISGMGSDPVLSTLTNVFTFPLSLVALFFTASDTPFWLFWIATSLLWSFVICWSVRALARRARQAKA